MRIKINKTNFKIIAVVLFVLFMFIMWIKPHVWADVVTGVVTDKHIKNGTYYIVVKEEGSELSEQFENVDDSWRFKYNSSDVYNNMDKGDKVILKVTGRRIPFLSSYRNISSYKKN